jgi:hypothetical protein
MDEIKITTSYLYSPAEIIGKVMDDGSVKIFFRFNGINQERHEIHCSANEWDRFIAWVEWQRKKNV